MRVRDGVLSGVLAIGILAAIGDLLMSVSTIVENTLISDYGDNVAVAGIGVAMRVTMITGCLCIGLGQGIQLLLGYCVGAKLEQRYRKVLRSPLLFARATSMTLMALCYLFAPQLVGAFLSDQNAYDYALAFTRIILATSFLFGGYYVLLNAIQSSDARRKFDSFRTVAK